MAQQTEVLEVEARLQDFITGKLGGLEAKITQFGRNSEAAMNRASKAGVDYVKVINQLATGVVAVKTLDFFRSSVAAADEAVIAYRKLQVATGDSAAALAQQASALQRVTLYGDEQIMNVQALLGMYTKNGETISKLTPKILDMASALGIDVHTAVLQVGRALTSSTGELGRYGIAAGGAAGSSERLDGVLAALETRFGGQAEAVAAASSGMVQLKNAFNDLQEQIGIGLMPVLKKAADYWTDVLAKMNQAPEIKQLAQLNRELAEEMDAMNTAYLELAKYDDPAARKKNAELVRNLGHEYDQAAGNVERLKNEIAKLDKQMASTTLTKEGGISAPDRDKDKEKDKEKAATLELADAHVQLYQAIEEEGARQAKLHDERLAYASAWEAERKKMTAQDAEWSKKHEENVQREIELEKLKQDQMRASVDATFQAGHSVMRLAEMMVEGNVRDARKRQKILSGMAVAESAGAAVKGLYTVWNGPGETWYKVAMSVVTMAEIIGMAASQISSINSQRFARGTRSARGGMALVGEFGPEMVSLPSGATVYNNTETRNMFDQRREQTTHLNVTVHDASGNITERIRTSLRTGEGNGLVEDLRARFAMAA